MSVPLKPPRQPGQYKKGQSFYPHYVDIFEEDEEIKIAAVEEQIDNLKKELTEVRKEMKVRLKELGS